MTLVVGGLLVIAGCTVPGGHGAEVRRDRPGRGAAVAALGPGDSAAPAGSVAGRVLGVVWHGREGAETAELAWLHPLTLRPRPGRRLALGDHGVAWAVAPDQSLALLAGGGDSNDGRLLVVDPRRLRRLGSIRLRRTGGSGRSPPAGSGGRGWCWPARASSSDRRRT